MAVDIRLNRNVFKYGNFKLVLNENMSELIKKAGELKINKNFWLPYAIHPSLKNHINTPAQILRGNNKDCNKKKKLSTRR